MKKSSLVLALLVVLFCSHTQANTLRSSDFLEYSEVQQHWWYFGALQSISHMAYLLHGEKKAECVWNWLPNETEKKKALLRQSFEQFPDHSTTSILIALLQRSCGELIPDTGQ